MTGRLLVPVDAGGPAEDEALDDRGQLEGRVTLQVVVGFLDVNDLGGRQAAQQFPLAVIVQHRVRPSAPGDQHRHGPSMADRTFCPGPAGDRR
jgi:hypothetical protein